MVKLAACPLCLSQTRTCTYDSHTNTVPLMAHLTPETPEPREGQMVDAGRGLVCELVPSTLQIENRQHHQRTRSEQKVMTVCCCMSRFGIPFQSSLLFYVLPTPAFWQPQRSYRCYWFLPALRTANALLVQTVGKRSHHSRQHAKRIRT